MVMIILERVRPSVKGELSRWLMEPVSGVFLGHVSAIVRDLLWDRCLASLGNGGCILIHSAQTEQGFAVRTAGALSREIIDAEGLYLVRKKLAARRAVASAEKVDT